jgi:hypothetical protein
MNNREIQTQLRKIVETFIRRIQNELQLRLRKWPTDLEHKETREVVGALLSRQVTLATQLAASQSNWNGHAAPLFLRAMADVYINLAWVLSNPNERSKKFVVYGLGQRKLELEHRRAELETRKPKAGELEMIQFEEDWINRQRATFLTDVNLGSWSGISTRAMAIEADCLDFYHYVYTPFSACVHSMWHHVAKYNLIECGNPLHMQHAVPTLIEAPIDPHYLHLAARYLQKSFKQFDNVFDIAFPKTNALQGLTSGLNQLERKITSKSTRTKPSPKK